LVLNNTPETVLPRDLQGKVAVVTGASRGVGKGIALGLGDAGATVYVTGRTLDQRNAPWPGTIGETATAVTHLGGRGIAVCCDHRDDVQVKALFRQVQDEQGRLDVLVNNATSFGATPDGYPQEDVPFWELPVALWDEMHVVGLRSHYVAAICAAPTMIGQRSGLIVNISSNGATSYVFNAAYGVVKAGVDKLTADMAHDLQPYNVAVLSLRPPFTKTEKYVVQAERHDLSRARSPEFTGRAVVALAADPKVMEKTGRVFRVTDLAGEYGFTD
jgi:dehydrogenase/reductase SDR family member 1